MLVHTEIQARKIDIFTRRMYTYNYRIFDLFDRKSAGLAIPADDNPNRRPDHFAYELWGTRTGLWFPCVKLLEYKNRWEELEKSTNPFA